MKKVEVIPVVVGALETIINRTIVAEENRN